MDEEQDFDGGGHGEYVETDDENTGAQNNSDVSPALETQGAQNDTDVPPASDNGEKPARDRTDIPDQRWDELIAERNRLRDEAAANQPYIEALKGLGEPDAIKQRLGTFAETERQKQQSAEDQAIGDELITEPTIARMIEEGEITETAARALLVPAFKQLNTLQPLAADAQKLKLESDYKAVAEPLKTEFPYASETELRLAYIQKADVRAAAEKSHNEINGIVQAALSKQAIDLQGKKKAPTANGGMGGSAPVNNGTESPGVDAGDAAWDAWWAQRERASVTARA